KLSRLIEERCKPNSLPAPMPFGQPFAPMFLQAAISAGSAGSAETQKLMMVSFFSWASCTFCTSCTSSREKPRIDVPPMARAATGVNGVLAQPPSADQALQEVLCLFSVETLGEGVSANVH